MSLFDQLAAIMAPASVMECPMFQVTDETPYIELDLGEGDEFLIFYEFDHAEDLGWMSETDPAFPDGPTYPEWVSDWELQGFRIIRVEKAIGDDYVPVKLMGVHEFEKLYKISKLKAEREYEEF